MLVSRVVARFFRAAFLSLLIFPVSLFAAQAPAFDLPSDNGRIDLKQYRGKVIYLDFWASWCVPCRKSFPWMNKMHSKYQSKGLVVLAINLDEERSAAKAFLKQVPASFPIAYDAEGVTPGKYNVQVMPSSFLIDRNGNLVDSHRGFKKSQADAMEQKIVSHLGK